MNLNKNQCPDCVDHGYSSNYPVHYPTTAYATSAYYYENNLFSIGWKILGYLLKLFVILALLFTLITVIVSVRHFSMNNGKGFDDRYLRKYGANSYGYNPESKSFDNSLIKTCSEDLKSVKSTNNQSRSSYIFVRSIVDAITAVGVIFVSNNTIKAITNYSNNMSFGAYFTSIAKGIVFDAKLIVIRTWDNIHILGNRTNSLLHGVKYDPAQYHYTSALKSYDDAKVEYEAAKHQWMNSMHFNGAKIDLPPTITLSAELPTSPSKLEVPTSTPDVNSQITALTKEVKADEDKINNLKQEKINLANELTEKQNALKKDDNEITNANTQHTTDQSTISDLTKEVARITQQKKTYADNIDKLKSQIKDLNKEISTANGKDEALTNANTQHTVDQSTISDLNNQHTVDQSTISDLTAEKNVLQDKYDRYVTATHDYHYIKAKLMEIGIDHDSHFANINHDYINYVAAFVTVLLAYRIIKVVRNTAIFVVHDVPFAIYQSIVTNYYYENTREESIVYAPLKGKKRVFVV